MQQQVASGRRSRRAAPLVFWSDHPYCLWAWGAGVNNLDAWFGFSSIHLL